MRNVNIVFAFVGALASYGVSAPSAYAYGEVPPEQGGTVPPEQGGTYVEPQTQEPHQYYYGEQPQHRRRRSRIHVLPNARDFELTAGAGFSDFTGSTMRSVSDGGAMWDARFTAGARSILAFEAGYVGTFNSLETPSGAVGASPQLISNGLDGDLRINLVPWILEPYVFGGVGYNHMSIRNRFDDPAVAARFNSSDNQLLVPAGAGLALNLGHFMLDARFTYRAIFNNDLDRFDRDIRLDQYNIAGRLGVIF